VSGLLFSAVSATWTGLVPNIDSFNYFFSLILTPLYLLSGVFFPISGMPVIVQKIAWFSPLYHLVNIARGLVNGNIGVYLAADIVWLLVVALLILPAPVYLLRRLIIK
jgi:lipooligosaccharide transport system permease protein